MVVINNQSNQLDLGSSLSKCKIGVKVNRMGVDAEDCTPYFIECFMLLRNESHKKGSPQWNFFVKKDIACRFILRTSSNTQGLSVDNFSWGNGEWGKTRVGRSSVKYVFAVDQKNIFTFMGTTEKIVSYMIVIFKSGSIVCVNITIPC